MKNIKKQIEYISLNRIVADENQPRKNFDPAKLASLAKSIEKHGILRPIDVEKMSDGKYLLVDGERRLRAAKIAKLEEVPVIVSETSDPVEHLVRQFHIQEQYEGWNPLEKAISIIRLTEILKTSIQQVCSILGIPERSAKNYVAYANLANKEAFERSELPFHWASQISEFKRTFNNAFVKTTEDKMTRNEEKKLEGILIQKIQEGEITDKIGIAKLKDVIRQRPEMTKDILSSKEWTPGGLFRKAGAGDARNLRQVLNHCGYLTPKANQFISDGAKINLTKHNVSLVKSAIKALTHLLEVTDSEE